MAAAYLTAANDVSPTCLVEGVVLAGKADVKRMVVECGELPELVRQRVLALIDIQHSAQAGLHEAVDKVAAVQRSIHVC